MAITVREASTILGIPEDKIRDWQGRGVLPNPIPDDYFDSVIEFRIRLEQAFRQRYDRLHGPTDAED